MQPTNNTKDILEIIDNALACTGYKIMDGDSKEFLVFRNNHTDTDWQISLEELA
jgi:hypothetical protein